MRVSTAYIFDQNLSAMLNQQTELAKTQLQVSTGKRILSPSDDPAGSVQILNLQREFSISEQYLVNADKAENKQEIEEGTLKTTTDMLQRIRELAVQGLNSSNTQTDRQAIAIEISQLNDQLLALSNTRDSNGDYLFSGFKSNTQPYQTVNGDYQGDEGQRSMRVGAGVLIETNDPGNQIFEAPIVTTTLSSTLTPIVSDVLDVTSTAVISVASYTGGSDTFPAIDFTYSAGPPNEYVIDDGVNPFVTIPYSDPTNVDLAALNPNFPPMTVTLSGAPVNNDVLTVDNGVGTGSIAITNTSGVAEIFPELTFSYSAGPPSQYQVTDGSNSATFDYIDGMNIDLGDLNSNFPSLSLTLSGTPSDGDTIVIDKSLSQTTQSMFKTIDSFVKALNSNNVGANDSPNNGDFLSNISASLNIVTDARAKVGSRLNSISQQRETNEGLSLNMEKTLSEIQDLDYTEAISRLTLQTTALQAAQQSFVKVQGLSLFNFL